MFKLVVVAIIAATAFTLCPTDEFCNSCGANNHCLMCTNAFIADSGSCVQGDGELVEDCQTFETSVTCQTCNAGFYLAAGKCIEITIDKCAAVSSTDITKCVACFDNILPTDGKCDTDVKCTATNCDICGEGNVCQDCDKGYSINENSVCITEPIKNCRGALSNSCIVCRRGSFMATAECKSTDVQGSSVILSAFISLIAALKLFA